MDEIKYTDNYLQSIALGIYINAKIINQALISISSSLSGFALKGIYLCVVILWLGSILKKKYITKNVTYIFFPITLLIWYGVSLLVCRDGVSIDAFDFIVYVITPFLLIRNVNYKLVIETVMCSSAIAIPFSNVIFSTNIYTNSITMGLTYAILPSVVCAIMHFIFFRKKIVHWVFYTCNLFFLYKILINGVRGAVICLFVAISLFLCTKYDENRERITIKSFKLIVAFVIVVPLMIAYLDRIMLGLQYILAKFDISFRFIEKTISLLSTGNLNNGRDEFARAGINGFLHSPVIGNGISTFYHNTGLNYPHNFLIQLLYDGGLLLALIIVGIIVVKTYQCFISCEKDEYIFWIILFSVSIPSSFISGDLWEAYRLWLYIAFITNRGKR